MAHKIQLLLGQFHPYAHECHYDFLLLFFQLMLRNLLSLCKVYTFFHFLRLLFLVLLLFLQIENQSLLLKILQLLLLLSPLNF